MEPKDIKSYSLVVPEDPLNRMDILDMWKEIGVLMYTPRRKQLIALL